MMKFKLLNKDAKLPSQATQGSVGWDLYTPIDFSLQVGQVALIRLKIASELPINTAAIIKGKSGLGLRGIDVLAGVIDWDYRDEWGVILFNAGEEIIELKAGRAIAQFILINYKPTSLIQVEELDMTINRGGGFGSTGR